MEGGGRALGKTSRVGTGTKEERTRSDGAAARGSGETGQASRFGRLVFNFAYFTYLYKCIYFKV